MRLVLLGDCCSGVPGGPHEPRFRAIAEVAKHYAATADALCFLGDHIQGYTDVTTLRQQWLYFLGHEFAPIARAFGSVFHLPSNHTVYDLASAAIYGEMLPVSVDGKTVFRHGLNYAVEFEDAALIFVATANPANRGDATIDLTFLEEALRRYGGNRRRLVFGHHPIVPVNGYARHPLWRVEPDVGDKALALLRAADVTAYVCSHIIAFDMQCLGGPLQICTAGAGTAYGPGGAMPAAVEDMHVAVMDLTDTGLAVRSFGVDGKLREWIDWPPATSGRPIASYQLSADSIAIEPPAGWDERPDQAFWLSWRFTAAQLAADTPLLYAWCEAEAPAVLRMDLTADRRLTIRLVPRSGEGDRDWSAPMALAADAALEVSVHTGLGPGGVLMRVNGGEWQSLRSNSARGAEIMPWPTHWVAGVDLDTGRTAAPVAVEMSLAALRRIDQ